MLFSIFGLGGSYFIVKSRAVQQKRKELQGDYHVRPERSGMSCHETPRLLST
jgi:hypothetical protein